MIRLNARRCGIVGVVITVMGVGLYSLGHGTGETGAILAAMFGDQYTVRLTCDGGRAFSQYTHGFNPDHAGGKAERNHPGCRASRVTPVLHHRRAGSYNSGIRL